PEPALVPPRLRRAAAGLAGLCAVIVLVLAVRYHGDRQPGRLDTWVFLDLLGGFRTQESAMGDLSSFASPMSVGLAGVVLAVTFLVSRRPRLAALSVVGPAVTGVVVETGKHVVDRTIHGGLALPSGHTAGATSILLVIALGFLGRTRTHLVWAAVVALVAVAAGASVIGVAMVSQGAHYATDTVAGFSAAVVVTLALALAVDVVRDRRTQRAIDQKDARTVS
ncbi:MAG: hypothetical protein JWO98_1108, partial [Frankiales bacterium]|nr:hypothetical protein [Frankiales bacterium]